MTYSYDENGVEIGVTDSDGITRYYDTPEAKAFFTRKTGYEFKE